MVVRYLESSFGELGAIARTLKDLKEVKIERPPRVKLSAKESLKRTQEFDKRKEQFLGSVRKGKS